MTAWHNKPELKAEVLARMIAHREADEIVQGVYQELDPLLASGYKGCLIGCTLPKPNTGELGDWHQRVERLYGIPVGVGYLLDYTFEHQPRGAHAAFAVDSIEAIPVGADLSKVADLLALDLLAKEVERLDGGARDATEAVAALVQRRMAGDEPKVDEWDGVYLNAAEHSDAWIARLISDASEGHYGCAVSEYVYEKTPGGNIWVAERLLELLRTAPIPAAANAHHLAHQALRHWAEEHPE